MESPESKQERMEQPESKQERISKAEEEIRRAAARIDPRTAPMVWRDAQVVDPYGLREEEIPPEEDCIGRKYFLVDPQEGIWVLVTDVRPHHPDIPDEEWFELMRAAAKRAGRVSGRWVTGYSMEQRVDPQNYCLERGEFPHDGCEVDTYESCGPWSHHIYGVCHTHKAIWHLAGGGPAHPGLPTLSEIDGIASYVDVTEESVRRENERGELSDKAERPD